MRRTNSKRRDGKSAAALSSRASARLPLLLGQRPGSHPELIAPVTSPCRLGLLLFQRLLLTIADSLQAVRRDAETDQEPLGGGCAPVAERQIVFIRAPLVGVALDAK